ncbi:class I SAM-dependent methyltransferase [Marivita hallyeonensis]|uniref:O-antigen chain-terminating methyltransferase n=1 Tax=Marivita hallyeonensis TaxID=996342 RepID=A0A1M5Y5T4_9RHOB|nr:class I SAM-dependent methyltransferase [Marivita hallyeonensis]SHI06843.1 O-antigen chain-terminating methyltransferase [Marivita hallyeonensis]
MTSDEPSRPDVVVTSYTPSVEARLSVPAVPQDVPSGEQGAAKAGALANVAARLKGTGTAKASAKKSSHSGSSVMTKRRKLTPLKRFERYFSAIFKLGRTEYMAKDAKKRITHAELRMDDIEGELGRFGRDIREIWRSNEEFRQTLDGQGPKGARLMDDITRTAQRIEQHHVLVDSVVHEHRSERAHLLNTLHSETALMARVFADLSRRVDAIAGQGGVGAIPDTAPRTALDLPPSDGFDAFKDSFYHRLENRYRGSVEEIADRLRIYLPDVEAAVMRTGGKPVMDIGCGRGEWLGLLKRAGIEGFGVDTNAVQIEAAKEQGLDVRLGDALKALADQPDNSLALISAHHLVEHLPFDAVAWIAREAQRVLAPGGVLMFETPHTRNVLVGATTFHTDPTHLKPMPEQVLTVLFDTAGFDPVEVRALNPHERFKEFLDAPDFNDELAFLLFGPQDLAVLGTKPGDKDA